MYVYIFKKTKIGKFRMTIGLEIEKHPIIASAAACVLSIAVALFVYWNHPELIDVLSLISIFYAMLITLLNWKTLCLAERYKTRQMRTDKYKVALSSLKEIQSILQDNKDKKEINLRSTLKKEICSNINELFCVNLKLEEEYKKYYDYLNHIHSVSLSNIRDVNIKIAAIITSAEREY